MEHLILQHLSAQHLILQHLSPLCAPFFVLVLCLVALLGLGKSSQAQFVTALPITPASQAASDWYRALPARFHTHDRLALNLLDGPDMDAMLKRNKIDDPADVEGLFDQHARLISLRLSPAGALDPFSLSHEYGHYVWFRLLSRAQRSRYRDIYKRQSASGALISEYAATNLEEGFAEAFAFYLCRTAALRAKDPASFAFLQDRETESLPRPDK